MSRTSRKAKNKRYAWGPKARTGPQKGSAAPLQETAKTANKYLTLCIYLVLALSTLVVFRQLGKCSFIHYDDLGYVADNYHVKAGLTRESIIWAFTTGEVTNWHPLTWLSHMLDVQLFGTNPGWHHMTSLLLHVANTLLLFWLLKKMTGAIWPSAFVAAAFGLHPLHVESVAWISERKDVLSTLFWLLTMAVYLGYVRRPDKARYLITLLVFALGLMAKPMLVTLPFVLLLIDFWPLRRFEFENITSKGEVLYRIIVEKVPFLVLSAASCVITFVVQQSGGAVAAMNVLALKIRAANAFISYIKYIGKMAWPNRLAIFYPHPADNLPMWQAGVSVLLLIAVSILAVRLAQKYRYLPVGWFWYIGTLVPVIGLVQVGDQGMADRYSYIPLTGLFIIIAWGLPEMLGRWRYRKIALGISAPAVLLALSICTWSQVRYWRNSETVFTHALEVTSNNYTIQNTLGTALKAQGRGAEAVSHYRQALKIKPNFAQAHNNLAIALESQAKPAEAIKHYRQALQINPNDARVHVNLAGALELEGKFDEAIRHYRQALQLKPDFPEAHNNMGIALKSQGRLAEAIEHYRQALEIRPNFAEAHCNLANALKLQGNLSEALSHYRQALRLRPDWPALLKVMAQILATHPDPNLRNATGAIELAERAAELTRYQDPSVLSTLAAGYASAGQFERAVSTAEKALAMASAAGDNGLVEQIRRQLQFFRQPKR